MPEVNQLVDEFGSKGLVVIGVTHESQSETKKFLEDTGAKWTTVYDAKALEIWGVNAFPTSFLVAPSGTVVWRGNFVSGLNKSALKWLLRRAKADLVFPSKYAAIASLYEKDKFGEALAKIEADLAKEGLPEDEQDALLTARKQIRGMAHAELEDVKRWKDEKDYYSAAQGVDRLTKLFVGMEETKEAGEILVEMQAEPAFKADVEAGSKIAEATKKLESGPASYQAAWKALSAVIKAYPDSNAAAKAAKIQAAMREQGKYGFNSNCKECKKLGKACGGCRTSAKW